MGGEMVMKPDGIAARLSHYHLGAMDLINFDEEFYTIYIVKKLNREV